jgi:hypothetical protein
VKPYALGAEGPGGLCGDGQQVLPEPASEELTVKAEVRDLDATIVVALQLEEACRVRVVVEYPELYIARCEMHAQGVVGQRVAVAPVVRLAHVAV